MILSLPLPICKPNRAARLAAPGRPASGPPGRGASPLDGREAVAFYFAVEIECVYVRHAGDVVEYGLDSFV